MCSPPFRLSRISLSTPLGGQTLSNLSTPEWSAIPLGNLSGVELSLTDQDAIVVIGSLLRSERRHLAKARNAPDHLTAQAHRNSARQVLAIADRVTELCEEGI
jgi:hypothetical protein